MTIANLASEDVATLYAYPLFSKYDLEVEFERRLQLLKDKVEQITPFHFAEHHVEDLCSYAAPVPLELGDIRICNLTDFGGTEGCAFLIAFEGDVELWNLSPARDLSAPDGEIIRNTLLKVYLEPQTEALAIFQRELSALEDIIELQSNRILAFAQTLPSLVRQMHFDRLTWAIGAFGERLPRPVSRCVVTPYGEGAT